MATKRKKRRLNKNGKLAIAIIIALIVIIYIIIFLPSLSKEKQSLKLGYDEKTTSLLKDNDLLAEALKYDYSKNIEIAVNNEKINNDDIEFIINCKDYRADASLPLYHKLLTKNYQKDDLLKLFQELNFYEITPLLMFKHIDDINAYIQDVKNNQDKISETSFILSNDYSSYYEPTYPTENSGSITQLVNKNYYLAEDFVPANLVKLSSRYAADNMQLTQEAADALMTMMNNAQKAGCNFYVTSSYRSYAYQKNLYQGYVNKNGQEESDKISARPGHSEHQTGLVVDFISTSNYKMTAFKDTKDYLWLKENAHNYGFIQRFEANKEIITGYSAEEWHWRYVGIETAQKIKESNLTFDEYYLLYIQE